MLNFLKPTTIFVLAGLMLLSWTASSKDFKSGDTVFVAYPAGNIKDDAFIVGNVVKVLADGRYQVSVIDYVEGHDYGVSCVPMVKSTSKDNTGENGQDSVWDMWTDTTKLDKENLDYIISKKDVLELGYGKSYFIERNNLYIVFGRWKSDAPMLSADRMDMAIKLTKQSGLELMIPAFELAKLQRKSFYGAYGRPLYAFETIKPLGDALLHVDALFKQDEVLKKHWFSNERNWKVLAKDTKRYFLVEAIDKVVDDAKNQMHEEGIEKAAPEDLKQLKKLLIQFDRKRENVKRP